MRHIDKIYIDGAFVNPHGNEVFDLFNPTTGQVIGTVKLADEEDARLAIAAAKRAFPAFSSGSVLARYRRCCTLVFFLLQKLRWGCRCRSPARRWRW